MKVCESSLPGSRPTREDEDTARGVPMMALINPEITPIGRRKSSTTGRDVSASLTSAAVCRGHARFRSRAYDRRGKRVEIKASGFTARVIQHETDHLDGILFFDRMKSFQTLTFLDEFGRYWSGPDGESKPDGHDYTDHTRRGSRGSRRDADRADRVTGRGSRGSRDGTRIARIA